MVSDIAQEEWHKVVEAINALTEEQRLVLVIRLILGYDVETVGRMLGKKDNAIKVLQFRALQRLCACCGCKPQRAWRFLPRPGTREAPHERTP